MDYWAKKEKNKKEAEIHTKTMNAIYSDKIRVCIKETKLFDHMTPMQASEPQQKPDTIIVQTDVVTAAYKYHKGKTAVLNFASYKNPGGMFIKGSSAQEESLCHESFLYNVLQEFDHTYYEWNRKNINKALYKNRALYSPDVVFVHDGKEKRFDVITCAAPNYTAASRYNLVTKEQNTQALRSRMEFVKNIAEYNNVETLILGAYGCGVFGQNTEETAGIWKQLFETSSVKTIVHPIPDDRNYLCFKKVFNDKGATGK